MAYTNRGVALWLLALLAADVAAAWLVHGHTPGAHLELAPIFLALALVAALVRLRFARGSRSRSGRL